jgi:hypothetical protein
VEVTGLVREALDRAGAFFSVTNAPAAGLPGATPLAALLDDADQLGVHVRQTAQLLPSRATRRDTDHLRVAVSTTHLSWAARHVSPLLGIAAVQGVTAPPSLAAQLWSPRPGPFPVAWVGDEVDGVDPTTWVDAVVGQMGELVDAFAGLGAPRQCLWGNAASAVHGAVTVWLGTAGPGQDRMTGSAALLLSAPPLRSACDGAAGTPAFRRRSCCLMYRLSGDRARPETICGDCILGARCYGARS